MAIIEFVMMHNPGDTIRAAFLYNTLDVRVDRVALPNELRPNEALIQVSHAGICGSELHAIEGYEIVAGKLEKVVGGGLCKVSTTMYRAASNAGLEITRRSGHT